MEPKFAQRMREFVRPLEVNCAVRLVGRLEAASSKAGASPDQKLLSAHRRLARALMPGPNYYDVISNLLQWRPESWVEIGVSAGNSLALSKPPTKAIGIDPAPRVGVELSAKIYEMTSDAFFASHNLLEELGAPRLGLALIDGLHTFEQALRDFINLERNSDKSTVILIHDCLPITRLVSSRTPSTLFWCGDVWKVVVILLECRPDLKLFIVPAPPSGLAVVTQPDPGSDILAHEYDRILDEYGARELEYNILDRRGLAKLGRNWPIIPNEWESVVDKLV